MPWSYAVLALLSECYPPVEDRLLTRYSPVRHSVNLIPAETFLKLTSFDLHVLSTPPAFVLSQDQTLVFNPSTCDLRFRSSASFRSSELLPASELPASQAKTHFRINCRSSSSLCIVFKIPAPFLKALGYNTTSIPHCQHFFSIFFERFFFPNDHKNAFFFRSELAGKTVFFIL